MSKNEIPDSMYEKTLLIANMYYKNKMSQQEIATKLNISRPWVSKILARAEELGIVKIEVISPFANSSALENALMKRYPLKHVNVIKTSDNSKDEVAQTAANYFISNLRPKDVVAVGWGRAVSRIISVTPTVYFPDVHVVPMAGSFGSSINLLPTYNTIALSQRLNSKVHMLHTPAMCETQEEYDALTSSHHTKELLHMAEKADVLLLGIGAFETSIVPEYGILHEKDINLLKKAEAIGDVALQYLDKYGNPVDTVSTKRMIKADIFKATSNARTVIGMAEGIHKVPIIHVALASKLIDTFFTDEKTALALLEF